MRDIPVLGDHKEFGPVYLNVYQKDDGLGSGVSLWQTGVSYQTGDVVFYQGCTYSALRNHVGSRVRTPSGGRYWELITCSNCEDGGGGTGDNLAPIIDFMSPANNAEITAGNNVNIIVTASDPEGADISVSISTGSIIPCSLAQQEGNSDYACAWLNAPAGNHQLTAIAIDDLGASAEDSINIVVLGDNNCSRPGWLESKTYSKGEEVEYGSIRWRSKRTSLNVMPGTSPSKWSNLGLCAD